MSSSRLTKKKAGSELEEDDNVSTRSMSPAWKNSRSDPSFAKGNTPKNGKKGGTPKNTELTEMDSGLKGQRVKGRTPKAGSSKKQTEEATSSFMEDEKTSMTPTEMSSQFVATVMFAVWIILLLVMGVWMLRLIPGAGGFPPGGDD